MLDNFVNESFQLPFGHGADLGRLHFSITENHQSGYSPDAVLLGGHHVAVNIHFGNCESIAVFIGKFLNDGRDHFAGSAPLRPVIDQYRAIGTQDILVKTAVGDVFYVITQFTSPEFARLSYWNM